MQKKNLSLLFYKSNKTKTLVNSKGKILFIGKLKQIRKRLRTIFGNQTSGELFESLDLKKWSILGKPKAVLKVGGTVYNAYMEQLKEKLTFIPHNPGVYQFKNKDGEVIYVGKAKDLKNRVSQYFGQNDNRPQLPYLLAEASDITYTVVDNELESLFLENTLIKKYLPKYNIQLRDDKNYAFITIDYSCEIPAINYARKFDPNNKQVKYFGPYSAVYKIRKTLNLIRRIFPYCSATKISNRPCFYYYLHRCPGICIGKITPEQYKQQLNIISWFLSGNTSKIKQDLKTHMKEASLQKKYETAGKLRDQLQALEILNEHQNVILPKPVNWDVVSAVLTEGYGSVNLFKIREGKMLDKENFVFDLTNTPDPSMSALFQTFLERYYIECSSFPSILYVQNEIEDMNLILNIIRTRHQKKVTIIYPKKSKPLELVKLGIVNADEYIKNWLTTQAEHLNKLQSALKILQEVLKLDKIPGRIEGYDISNTQGTNSVGSMVVIKNGLPAKSEYRKFTIKKKPPGGGPDDFAMMSEMLTRRTERLVKNDLKFPKPDLIVIDGGKGQLSAALLVLRAFNSPLKTVPVIGLAKRIEEIFFPNSPKPLILPHSNPGLHMLQRLRDEAHRYGINFHRNLRSKQAIKSALDEIPGIGPKTKKILKEKFGTVSAIRKATLEELTATVGQRLAQTILQSL